MDEQRALWFLPEYPPDSGGIATYAQTVGGALTNLGVRLHYLVAQRDEAPRFDGEVEVVRRAIRESFERNAPIEILAHRRWLSELKQRIGASVYHVHLCEPSPTLHLTTLGTEPAPTILTLHNEMVRLFGRDDPDALMMRMLETAAVVTACSAGVTRDVATNAPHLAHRTVTIPNGISLPHEITALPRSARLLAIGRLTDQKGFPRLLRALPEVRRARPDVHLDIIGDGPDRDGLEALVGELGIADAVTLHGVVERDLVPSMLDNAQIVVAPSVHEGLPYALLEAGAHARPVIGSRIVGIEDVVIDGSNGVLIDQTLLDDDPSVLARAIVDLLADPDRAQRYGTAGRRLIERSFSLDTCARSYRHVYDAVTRPESDIAVVIPAFDAEVFLAEAIESVLAAADEYDGSVQILVVDDGSSDHTGAIAASFAARGVDVFRQPHMGGGVARDCGIALTRSRYIAHLDADDRWPIDRLARLAERLDATDTLDAVFGRAVEFADHSAPATARWSPDPITVRMPTVGLLRRAAHDRFGGFGPSGHNDQVQWALRALDGGLTVALIDDIVLERRIHASNTSLGHAFTADTSRVGMLKESLDRRRAASAIIGGEASPPPNDQ